MQEQIQTVATGVTDAAVAGQQPTGQETAPQAMPANAGQPQPDLSVQTGDPNAVERPPQHEQAVPYERFAQVNDQRQQLTNQNQLLQQQVALYQANPVAAGAPPANLQNDQAGRLQEAMQSLEQLGDDDGLYGKEARNVIGAVVETINGMQQQVAQSQFFAMNPDYHQVVGQGNQIAPALQHVLNQNPMILQQIQTHPDPMAAALYYGRWGQQQLDQQAKTQQTQQTAPGGVDLTTPPIAGAPGPNNLTPAMQGIAPHSVANMSTGAGLNGVNMIAGMTSDQFRQYRQQRMQQARQ